ncbi:hypothetical protein BKA66DRAFT_565565 [Pyrenochaeta sp. MPI-SDFR-AT-0127]|nr:hypothetical protein BKA66DRAFT_565565 [Pyrenochaeta sp. MPI-SDFR-AT-0127]
MATTMLLDKTPSTGRITTTPPTTPRSPKKVSLLASPIDVDIYNPIIDEYEVLNIRLRRKIQDYEIALLKMQLRERNREFQAMVQSQQKQETQNTVTELVLRIGRQVEQIEGLHAEVEMWKSHALEAKSMLERTYTDLSRFPWPNATYTRALLLQSELNGNTATYRRIPQTALTYGSMPSSGG